MSRRRFSAVEDSTPVEFLATSIKEYLHLPDLGALYVLLGSVAGNMLDGPPVWLMLVGPPSSGGSELLNLLLEIPGIFEAGMIDSAAAFLSGTAEKEKTEEATGGLLRQVGVHGGIVMKDFTSILALQAGERKKVLGVFRETYDGRWTRPTGSDGGKVLMWEGKCGFFAKVTGAIDGEHEASASLGERWCYFRMDPAPSHERSRRALVNSSEHSEWKKDMRAMVNAFFLGMDLKFNRPRDGKIGSMKYGRRRDLKDYEHVRLIRLGEVASRCRSSVRRNEFKGHIVGVRETELGTRITTALGQLYIGMEYIGVPEADRWKLLAKITMDSMPSLRRVIVERARAGEDVENIAFEIGSSRPAVKQAIEDLEVHGVLEYYRGVGIGGRLKYCLSREMEQELVRIETDVQPVGRKR